MTYPAMSIPMITQDELKGRVHYNHESGVFTWLTGQRSGKRAGSVRSNGYRAINFGKRGGLFYEHRLSFLYMEGKVPSEVDHINRDRCDNRWSNLRPVTRSKNMHNGGLRPSNKSGYTGVSWCKKLNKWRATITVQYKQRYLGAFDDPKDARKAYLREKHSLFETKEHAND